MFSLLSHTYCVQTELIWCLPNAFDTTNLLICFKFAICSIVLLNLGETCHLKDAVACFIIATLIRYDVMRFELVLWRNTMHEWVMNIRYQTWKAQGWFININRTPSKQWGMCDNIPHFPGHVIKFPCWHWNQAMLVKGIPASSDDLRLRHGCFFKTIQNIKGQLFEQFRFLMVLMDEMMDLMDPDDGCNWSWKIVW